MKYQLQEPVLYYTASLVDAYVAHSQINRKRLQLLGVAALLLAEKIAGVGTVTVHGMVYMCDNAYNERDVCGMEEVLVTQIHNVWPRWSSYHHLAHFAEQLQFPKVWFHVAQMYLERSLLNYSISRHPGSVQAASVCLLAAEAASKASCSEGSAPLARPSELADLCKHDVHFVRFVADEIGGFLLSSSQNVPFSKLVGTRTKFGLRQYSQAGTMSGVIWSDS